jgi:hypothetical protein
MKKRAESFICDSLAGRITYFFTNYHDVHNVYGRAAIRLDGKELVCFSWIEMYHQERDISEFHIGDPTIKFKDSNEKLKYIHEKRKPDWDANCTYCESDFIWAVQRFFHLTIEDALSDDDYIIKILAILDRRTGKRVLKRIMELGEYLDYPEWVKTFYKLRFEAELLFNRTQNK